MMSNMGERGLLRLPDRHSTRFLRPPAKSFLTMLASCSTFRDANNYYKSSTCDHVAAPVERTSLIC
jgi:hypothetical protein